ncbi:1-deoxy-D-xylulose-5-phosphate reductoisomerase [Pseudactinotalea sp. HY158]|uniref:1-deoxy-D-xylulose-5-phosphate reductoisomerase n=1 Tax=Pseudactinotalea sp. HY158 TaxID=2654547 RepID=UPI00129CE09B|nr:1-deoxy-D-xylulose-5-phosphate reductoisomerase [Pseudactinotalea sp. HY158]QGH69889.1 1-deoxy-D-xylulose-5-phosphate reductoisomerase [Pseudactinotalea sp. HY158]
MTRSVTLLGSTGSIGTQTLEVIAANPDRFTLTALAAGGANLELAARQAVRFEVEALALARGDRAEAADALDRARRDLGRSARPEVLVGAEAATRIAGAGMDVVLNGITGSVGLGPTLAALGAGSTVALANKESLVTGGALVRAARSRPDQIVPVDSAHSAIAQVLRSGRTEEVARLVLTASGGPFRGRAREELGGVTPEQVLAHPTRRTGPAVATNTATLVDQGLGLVEAHLLFDLPLDRIATVVHPQSIVHSMVEFVDGSTAALASPPDMRLPIGLGLGWPDRVAGLVPPCRWEEETTWTFEPVDSDTFPAIGLCRAAASASASHPAVLNAANEECVAAFLAGRLPFPGITRVIAHVLDDHDGVDAAALDLVGLEEIEEWGRGRARDLIAAGSHR